MEFFRKNLFEQRLFPEPFSKNFYPGKQASEAFYEAVQKLQGETADAKHDT